MSESTAAVAAAAAPATAATTATEVASTAVAATAAVATSTPTLPVTSEKTSPEAAAAKAAAEAAVSSGWVDPTSGTTVSFDKTGDAALDVALDFIGRAGFTHAHPAVQAAIAGDFSLLGAALAEKGVSGWEQHLGLAKDAYGRFAEKEATHTKAIQDACLHAAGGDEKLWADTLSWASANAEPHEKEQINEALKAGGVITEAVTAWLVNGYRGAPGVTIDPRAAAVNAAVVGGAGAAVANGPLDPSAYAREVAKLRTQADSRGIEGSREYAALQSRRAMYRG